MRENKIQSNCFIWHWNTYPQYRGLLCYNLNNSRNAIDGMQNKALGLIRGRADMTLYHKGRAYFIELKNESGRQTPEQKEWQALVELNGFSYYICRDLEHFKQIVYEILA